MSIFGGISADNNAADVLVSAMVVFQMHPISHGPLDILESLKPVHELVRGWCRLVEKIWTAMFSSIYAAV